MRSAASAMLSRGDAVTAGLLMTSATVRVRGPVECVMSLLCLSLCRVYGLLVDRGFGGHGRYGGSDGRAAYERAPDAPPAGPGGGLRGVERRRRRRHHGGPVPGAIL